MQVFVPVSHCKDTYNFDKANNFFEKVKKKETRHPVSFIRNLLNYSTNYASIVVPFQVIVDALHVRVLFSFNNADTPLKVIESGIQSNSN